MIPTSPGGPDPGAVEAAGRSLRTCVPVASLPAWPARPVWSGTAAKACGWAIAAVVADEQRLRTVLADAADALAALARALRRVVELERAADRVLLAGLDVAAAARLRADASTEREQADRTCAARLRGLPWTPVTDPETLLAAAVAATGWAGLSPGDAAVLGALAPASVAADLTAPVVARLVAAPLVLTRDGVATAGRTWLLAGDGRVAEVWGDITTARHVVVVVPGTGTSERHWGSAAAQGEHTWQALRAATGGDGAVVEWLGSPEPPNLAAAALLSWAEKAAPALSAFVRGLPLLPGAVLTLVGHSYGAVVAGMAVRGGGLRPAALVGVGPAGFGPDVRSVRDLGRVPTYVLEDARDPIRLVPEAERLPVQVADLVGGPVAGFVLDETTRLAGLGHLGASPVCLPGAVQLASADDDPLAPPVRLARHGAYFDEGSVTLRQVAAVAAGMPARTTERCALRLPSGR